MSTFIYYISYQWVWFLFVWFDSLCPINNISAIKGRVFLGWTSSKLGLLFLLKDTTQWRRWGSNPRPLGVESSTLLLRSRQWVWKVKSLLRLSAGVQDHLSISWSLVCWATKSYMLAQSFIIQASRWENKIENHFCLFLTKTYVVGAQNNRLNETVVMSTQNTCWYWWVRQ